MTKTDIALILFHPPCQPAKLPGSLQGRSGAHNLHACTVSYYPCRASRGIGLELVRQLLSQPSNLVVASCRNPDSASDLKGLDTTAKGKLHVVQLDVADEESISAIAAKVQQIVGDHGLDFVVNNAAIVSNDRHLL
jgi:hypothetical protein